MVDGLRNNKSIQKLDLHQNEIKDVGAQCISHVLDVRLSSPPLRELDVSANMIYDEGIRFFSEEIKMNTLLETLYLDASYHDEGQRSLSSRIHCQQMQLQR